MKEGGYILANVFKDLEKIIGSGISTKELDKFVYNRIRKYNAKPSFKGYGDPPFPASICSSINDAVIHGVPNKNHILQNGDIVGIDIGVCYKGYHSDRAFTFMVGDVSDEARNLIEKTQESFFNGVKTIKNGSYVGDISSAIQETIENSGYSLVRDFQGHGIGISLHEEPNVPNIGKKGSGALLKTNMVIAVEPMVNIGSPYIYIDKDNNWTVFTQDGSLSAHYEHTVVVTENGFEILTSLEDDPIIRKYLS